VLYHTNFSKKVQCSAQDSQIFQCLNAEAFGEFAAGNDQQLWQGPWAKRQKGRWNMK
jgi:hypothetical protein